ncbi:hypothetical protein, partial [Burkholderia ambifaria]|uniref:hypothetical protein n=2 Tax=Burkholderia ambifaria TaxID=152480 RepID=UPI001ABB050D
IRSVAAIAASGAGHPAAVQLTRHESGHFYVAKSGHFNLAITTQSGDNQHYVKFNCFCKSMTSAASMLTGAVSEHPMTNTILSGERHE